MILGLMMHGDTLYRILICELPERKEESRHVGVGNTA